VSLEQLYPEVSRLHSYRHARRIVLLHFHFCGTVCLGCLVIFTYFRSWFCPVTNSFFMAVWSGTVDGFWIDYRLCWTLRHLVATPCTSLLYAHASVHSAVAWWRHATTDVPRCSRTVPDSGTSHQLSRSSPLFHQQAASQSQSRLVRLTAYRQSVRNEVKVILRPTVNRPVCPGIRPPTGTRKQIFFHVIGNYF
jgi:hypothetical protein